ncbi:class IV adenylate cyclase [Streptomyces specialis]|uniref:class IV adenylate cyclase n=1 Tax=Streptomyces specialis TaxID=498367 RepID=UPI00073E2877|nr:class IV adenylate cyclase [Streptomyces specialis]
MIEAELKARVRNPEEVARRLDALAPGRSEVYQDAYYDRPDGELGTRGHELRIRTVLGPESTVSLLTFKGSVLDEASGSKPEQETRVEDPEATDALLRGLGYEPVIAFQKRCRNHAFDAHGRKLLATLVRVPEIAGTFIEIETLVADDEQVPDALAAVRGVLADLGISEEDLTRELYTDAVAARRG